PQEGRLNVLFGLCWVAQASFCRRRHQPRRPSAATNSQDNNSALRDVARLIAAMLPAQSAVWIAAALMSEPVRASGERLGGLHLCLKCPYQSQLGHGVRPSPPVLPRRTWRGQARVMEYGA